MISCRAYFFSKWTVLAHAGIIFILLWISWAPFHLTSLFSSMNRGYTLSQSTLQDIISFSRIYLLWVTFIRKNFDEEVKSLVTAWHSLVDPIGYLIFSRVFALFIKVLTSESTRLVTRGSSKLHTNLWPLEWVCNNFILSWVKLHSLEHLSISHLSFDEAFVIYYKRLLCGPHLIFHNGGFQSENKDERRERRWGKYSQSLGFNLWLTLVSWVVSAFYLLSGCYLHDSTD